MFHGYRNGAAARNYAFDLSWEQFQAITALDCFYCGIQKGNAYRSRPYATVFSGSGIDRYDNSLGYTAENSVPCCTRCNFLKGRMRGDAFLAACRAITNNHSIPPVINDTALYATVERIAGVSFLLN